MVAKKITGSPRKSRGIHKSKNVLTSAVAAISGKGWNNKNVLRKVKANPISMYIAGGVGAFFLGRFLFRYYKSHPEISTFIRENFDTLESKLREYKDSFSSDSYAADTEARH